ncbi:MAG TPA: DUF1080 domain-containing protein, partial [Gemmataceae bacterium]|nr:DUF1080 domain-containing protein [Gemmataceae bacterium]
IWLALACSLFADEKPKPNTLTPKEMAEGWILMFDGETTFGWNAGDRLKLKEASLVFDSTMDRKPGTTTAFGDVELAFRFFQTGAKDVNTRAAFTWGNHPMLRLVTLNAWVLGEVQAERNRLSATFDFTDQNDKSESSGKIKSNTTGRIQSDAASPLQLEIPDGVSLSLHSIKIKPLGLKSVFNGKDLDGWKEHPGKKSKFSVTPEGWLHIKDGPGDLQTEALYDDFILQIECKTNGKQLNSGVFFRCRPGEYQQGYEAQIHNGFDADKPKEYVVEEYDPKTNELKAKNKVKSPAVDYGTGGIYRRVPARKQAAKDGEWFTMTVIAHGRHIATWVNGVQMVDWSDNRPLKDNARNGCRLEKGAISLQGHDPTTDLYFRNIRVAELPKGAEKK